MTDYILSIYGVSLMVAFLSVVRIIGKIKYLTTYLLLILTPILNTAVALFSIYCGIRYCWESFFNKIKEEKNAGKTILTILGDLLKEITYAFKY